MKIITILVFLFTCFTGISQTENQDQTQTQNQDTVQTQIEDEKKENAKFRKLAINKTIELQEELSLNIYAARAVEKTIYKYSIQANKVIQSNLSAKEKSKSLSNIIYFQNEELKKVLTVPQFYQYLNLSTE
ncbi:hypothetical protein [Aquimarina sp. MMG016]|uniref:hypothetical protein n=1 Tax=Aquimarina sp. MMG016 TaxID=2822690 RepID=UPI001B39ECDB|nr:hypothetical protein [Aquimarina sp. MMG016]MBQ4821537.1 hypothetical protein [Aquimarina sp. MMG016]